MQISILVDEEGNVALWVDGSEHTNDLNPECATRRLEITIDVPTAQQVAVPAAQQQPATVK